MAEHVCPVWVGYLLASPIRRLFHNPGAILGPYIKPGMTVLDVGCAMGFFTLPMAHLVGPGGVVIGADLQPRMLDVLERRARKAGVADRIQRRQCGKTALNLHDLSAAVDFALAFAVVHETPDDERFFAELAETLKPGGALLFAEPSDHVTNEAFALSLSAAERQGLTILERPRICRSHAALLAKRA